MYVKDKYVEAVPPTSTGLACQADIAISVRRRTVEICHVTRPGGNLNGSFGGTVSEWQSI